jgi:hypothetical protein
LFPFRLFVQLAINRDFTQDVSLRQESGQSPYKSLGQRIKLYFIPLEKKTGIHKEMLKVAKLVLRRKPSFYFPGVYISA